MVVLEQQRSNLGGTATTWGDVLLTAGTALVASGQRQCAATPFGGGCFTKV